MGNTSLMGLYAGHLLHSGSDAQKRLVRKHLDSKYWAVVGQETAQLFWDFEAAHPDIQIADRLLARQTLLARFVLYLQVSDERMWEYEKNKESRERLVYDFLKRETGH